MFSMSRPTQFDVNVYLCYNKYYSARKRLEVIGKLRRLERSLCASQDYLELICERLLLKGS